MAAEGVGIVFCSVEAIIAVVRAITEAAETVRQNKYECEDIARTVVNVSAILTRLCQSTPAMAVDPAMGGALEDLAVSLERALDLVTDCCQHGNRLRRFLGAGDMARELRRVQEDITRKVTLGIFAVSVQTFANMPYSPAPPPLAGAAWSWNPAPPSMAPWLHPAPWSMPAPSVPTYEWPYPVPTLSPQPMPWPRPSMADFCCPNNWLRKNI